MGASRVCLPVTGLVVFGALNTLTTKMQFTMVSAGITGEDEHFVKPWFVTFLMFAGMAFVLIPMTISNAMSRTKVAQNSDEYQQLVGDGAPQEKLSELKQFFLVGIPAVFDLVASGLMFAGLIFISASIWQMLRGSEIVFAALISVPLLGRKLHAFHWIGVLLCVIGITLVGGANILNARAMGESQADSEPKHSTNKQLFGMGLVVVSQVLQATQMVVEEILLKEVDLPPMKIVGYEGVWGSIICILVVFPICWFTSGQDNGHAEDTLDTLEMLKHNSALVVLVLVYVFSCATYNVSGMAVTSCLTAVHRTMLEASRTIGIWVIDLCFFYFAPSWVAFRGEAWMPYSTMQLLGFAVLLAGQSVYGSVLKVPGLYYPPKTPAAQWQSPKSVLSPMPLPPAESL